MNPILKYQNQLKKIKMLAVDVDGVLTDGKLHYTSSGEHFKSFNAKDGLGLKLLQEKGFIVAVITARKSDIVELRMKELGIRFLYQGVDDKFQMIEGLTGQFMFYWENIAYIGDDLPDLPVLEKVGFAACPADAVEEVLLTCHYVANKTGGMGVVREVADLILKANS